MPEFIVLFISGMASLRVEHRSRLFSVDMSATTDLYVTSHEFLLYSQEILPSCPLPLS
jgi:hypothetical protein